MSRFLLLVWEHGYIGNFYSMQFADYSRMQFASEVSSWWWKGCYCESSGIPLFHFVSTIITFFLFWLDSTCLFLIILLFFLNHTENSKRQESESGHPWIRRQGAVWKRNFFLWKSTFFYAFVSINYKSI